MEPGYVLAFATGLLGGFGHCIGMCGPIVASYTLASHSAAAGSVTGTLLPHIFYNAGRVMSYGLIGAFMGLTGSFVNVAGRFAGVQNFVAVISGVIMILMGLSITGIWGSTRWIEKHNLSVLRAAQVVASSASSARFLLLGLTLGLLPCGLSYTVFIAAAGSGGPLPGMNTALLFGLGTVPALLAFGAAVSTLSSRIRGAVYRAGGVLVIIMGIYFFLRGVRLYAGL